MAIDCWSRRPLASNQVRALDEACGKGSAINALSARMLAMFASAFVAISGLLAQSAWADDAVDPHAHHHQMMMPETTRTTATCQIPDITLVRDDGKSVSMRKELDDGRPVVLSFIYTTCTSVCPMQLAAPCARLAAQGR
jgi:cytochrome oxidase Cu insertion factor (SCO1/SenC/PrrC family)